MYKIESFLAARLFLQPQLVSDRIFFLSNLSGHISLYAMDYGGSVPEPLLPPQIALQNPHLIGGKSFYAFPKLKKILVMIDNDGDENYQPMIIPIEGGFPQAFSADFFRNYRTHLGECDPEKSIFYLSAESRQEQKSVTYQCNLQTGEILKLGESAWGAHPEAATKDHTKVILSDGYAIGDHVLYLWTGNQIQPQLIYGTPIEQRQNQLEAQLNGIGSINFTEDNQALILATTLFDDASGLGYLELSSPGEIHPVTISGAIHSGAGEFVGIKHLVDERYSLEFNIDGCSWLYEAEWDLEGKTMHILHILCGTGKLSDGVLEAFDYELNDDRFILAHSTATSPTQIYTIEGPQRDLIFRHTSEKILGIPSDLLSSGEDASFSSFDGTRISARLYLPDPELGYDGPRPVVYYIHGGPQSQERPDFAWFSMPLIQFLILKGFAVFVPNVRGSTGYGLSYTKQVDRDWGGKDRIDHVFAMTEVLPKDKRLDTKHSGVVGRSYGGYMTLTLAGRHAELWSASVDMFGPYDLLTFLERIPQTWKPYYKIVLGDPNDPSDRIFLEERSPKTYLDNLKSPLLVIQGKNDRRVVERESSDLVNNLKQSGKSIEYLMFENEGHDVLKYENRVTCYNAITDFFVKHLKS